MPPHFTNADSVKLYKNDLYLGQMFRSDFAALPYAPILLDPLGEQLTAQEGYTGKAEELRLKWLDFRRDIIYNISWKQG